MNTRKLANVVALLLLIAVVAPFVVYAAPWTIGADESYVVLTASMTPAIAPGDVVVVDDRGTATVAEGDVITFRRADGAIPVTHRVIGVEERGGERAFATKGDANEDADSGLVPASDVVGTVVVTIPYLGYVIQFGNSPYGFLALVVVPFGLLAITEVWSLVGPRLRAGRATETPSSAESADSDGDGSGLGDGDDSAASASAETSAVESVETPANEPIETAVAESAESPADEAASTAAESDQRGAGGAEISLDAVTGAAAVLALGAPYAVFVAVRLRSSVTLAVAFAAVVTLVGTIGILLAARRAGSVSDAAPEETEAAPDVTGATTAPDGGTPVPPDGGEFEPADPVDASADDGRAER